MTATTTAGAVNIGASGSVVVNPDPIHLDPRKGGGDWYILDHSAQAEPPKLEFLTRLGQPTHCLVAEPSWMAVKYGRMVFFIQGRPSPPHDEPTIYVDPMLGHISAQDTMAKPLTLDDQKLSASAATYAAAYGYMTTEQGAPTTPSEKPIYETPTSFIVDLTHNTSVEDLVSIHVGSPQSEGRPNPAEIQDYDAPLLQESIEELKEATEYAADEGWSPPTPDSMARTAGLLRRMFDIQPHRYWIYPTPEGELVIDGGYQDHRVIVTLPSEGGAIYTYTDPTDGQISAVECPDPKALPDRQMVKILGSMGEGYGLA